MKKVYSVLAIALMALLFTGCDKSGPDKSGENYVVQPSWSESFHYANKAIPSQWPFTILAIALFVVGVLLLVKWVPKFKDPKWPIIGIFFIFFGGGVASLISKPNQVRMDNVKTVPIEYFKQKGQTYILDSLFETNHMTGAASKK